MSMNFTFELFLIPLAYLIGSISFAVVVSKCMRLPDPYSYGSGNPGATNVLRTGNKLAAVLTLMGDALKGFFAVMDAAPVYFSFVVEQMFDELRSQMTARIIR